MLTFSPATRIYLAAGATDTRKSFDTLAGLTRAVLEQEPTSGHLFVFCNRGRNRLKILLFDGSGMWVLAKRLDRGTFAWPTADETRCVELRSEELAALLGGIDFSQVKQRSWRRRGVGGPGQASDPLDRARKKLEESLLLTDARC